MALLKNITEKNIVLPDIPDHPHHPVSTFIYPKCKFSKKKTVKCSFQSSWLVKWNWLHYCEDKNVFCHTCISVLRQKKMQLKRGDTSLLVKDLAIRKMEQLD